MNIMKLKKQKSIYDSFAVQKPEL